MMAVLSRASLALCLAASAVLVQGRNRHCQAECYVSNGNWFSCSASARVKTNSCGPGSTPKIKSSCSSFWRLGCNLAGHADCQCETHCQARAIMGHWKPRAAVVGSLAIRVEEGTKHANEETKTSEWSSSVTSKASANIAVPGVGGVSSSLSVALSRKLTHAHRRYFESSKVEVFQITLGAEAQGKYLWQWDYEIHDTCLNTVITDTKEFAVTAGVFEKPCCVPGYCLDLASHSCSVCHSKESLLPDAGSHCRVRPNDTEDALAEDALVKVEDIILFVEIPLGNVSAAMSNETEQGSAAFATDDVVVIPLGKTSSTSSTTTTFLV